MAECRKTWYELFQNYDSFHKQWKHPMFSFFPSSYQHGLNVIMADLLPALGVRVSSFNRALGNPLQTEPLYFYSTWILGRENCAHN